MTAKTVVGAVDIEAAVEDVGFAVGSVFPGRKVGVEGLH